MAVIVCRLAISVILVVTIMVSLGCYCLDCCSCEFDCLWFVDAICVCGYVWWVFGFRLLFV